MAAPTKPDGRERARRTTGPADSRPWPRLEVRCELLDGGQNIKVGNGARCRMQEIPDEEVTPLTESQSQISQLQHECARMAAKQTPSQADVQGRRLWQRFSRSSDRAVGRFGWVRLLTKGDGEEAGRTGGTDRHEGATAQLFTHSESGERVQRLEGKEEVWRTPRAKASRSSDPGGLVFELNIDRARVTDALKFRLRSRTHVECTQLGLPPAASHQRSPPQAYQGSAIRQPALFARSHAPPPGLRLRWAAATVAAGQCRTGGLCADDVRGFF